MTGDFIFKPLINYLVKLVLGVVLVIQLTGTVSAQEDKLKEIVGLFETYNNNNISEKIFIHTDRHTYLTGEIMWFKLYYTDASHHLPFDLSSVAYLEVINTENKAVIQSKINLNNQGGDGSLFIPTHLQTGEYQIRVYTNWMKNYDHTLFSTRNISIINSFKQNEAIQSNSEQKFDFHFFPEGGNLIESISTKIAFRSVDINGYGQNYSGFILDQSKDTVAIFKPEKFGIGNFTFTPQKGNQYSTYVRFSNGNTEKLALPTIRTEGYSIKASKTTENSISVAVEYSSNNTTSNPNLVYLLVHSRHEINHAFYGILENGKAHFLIDKSLLKEGVSHITLFDQQKQPMCERLIFKKPAQEIQTSTTTDKNIYGLRKPVILNINQDSNTPTSFNYSVSVHHIDSLHVEEQSNISTYFFLESDLQGTIESPNYYFENNGVAINRQLDNLMLTHGWRRFEWNKLLQNPVRQFEYIPEHNNHIINGSLTDKITKELVSGKMVYLAAKGSPIQVYGSRSDSNGKLLFETKRFVGPKELVFQTNSLLDSTYSVNILDPFVQNIQFTGIKNNFVLSKLWESQILSRSIHLQATNVFYNKELNTSTLQYKDTLSFYGLPDKSYQLDDYTRFPVMEEVLREYVPKVFVKSNKGDYHFNMVDDNRNELMETSPLMLLDGIPIFDANKIIEYDPRKVKSLEIISQRYFQGLLSFEGIMSFETYNNDLDGFKLDENVLYMDYEGIQKKRVFYSPKYNITNNKNLPDFRSLLYWSPSITTDKAGNAIVNFYTSDIQGKFKIDIQGINLNGSTSHTYQYIIVED